MASKVRAVHSGNSQQGVNVTPQHSTGPSSASLRIAIHTAPHSAGRQSGLTLLSGSQQNAPRPVVASQHSARHRHTAPCNSSAEVFAGHCMPTLDPAALDCPHHAVTRPFCTLRLSNRAQKQTRTSRGGTAQRLSQPAEALHYWTPRNLPLRRYPHCALCERSRMAMLDASCQRTAMPADAPPDATLHTHAFPRRRAVWLRHAGQCSASLDGTELRKSPLC